MVIGNCKTVKMVLLWAIKLSLDPAFFIFSLDTSDCNSLLPTCLLYVSSLQETTTSPSVFSCRPASIIGNGKHLVSSLLFYCNIHVVLTTIVT